MNNNLLISHAAELVTCSGFGPKKGSAMAELGIIGDGALAIEKGKIVRVGTTADVLSWIRAADRDRRAFDTIDASGKAVLPGFVDSHTHLVFGGDRVEEFGWRLAGDSYMEILRRGGGILRTVADTRSASHEELTVLGLRRLDSMLAFGVTTVESKSGYGLDRDTEIKQLEVMAELNRLHPIDVVPTFMGAHAVPPEFKGREDAFIDVLLEEVLPAAASLKLAEFCDVFCEKGVFTVAQSRRLLTAARQAGLKPKLHADEIVPLGGAELAAELGAVSADHLLHASDEGIRAMAASGVVATLLPGTAFSLKAPYARGRAMIDAGCAVALATDFNPGSCFSESVALVAALAAIHMNLSAGEIVAALTINAAAALDRAQVIGSLDPGKQGDVVILENPSHRFIPYRVGVNAVEKVIKNGVLVYDKLSQGGLRC
ncbi:MAG: imidazolonepropionase [Desulfobacterales bacterium]|jgi:imidazolonepropionase|nr:imidazolonepropionase [Desulfobacterales bacterium]